MRSVVCRKKNKLATVSVGHFSLEKRRLKTALGEIPWMRIEALLR